MTKGQMALDMQKRLGKHNYIKNANIWELNILYS